MVEKAAELIIINKGYFFGSHDDHLRGRMAITSDLFFLFLNSSPRPLAALKSPTRGNAWMLQIQNHTNRVRQNMSTRALSFFSSLPCFILGGHACKFTKILSP